MSALIWTRTGFVEDVLTAERGAIFFTAEEATARITSGAANVLLLDPGDNAGAVAGRLSEIDAVFLRFPNFSDGRGFSAARLLREKYGFPGKIRAVGHFILDQIPLMLRVGIDEFAVTHEPTVRRLEAGDLPWIELYLQPAWGREANAGGRAWARRAGGMP